MIKDLENDMNLLSYKAKFIQDYLTKKIILDGKKGSDVLKRLEELKYPKLSNNTFDPPENKTYSYLTTMQIWSLTEEKIDELNKELEKSKKKYDEYVKTSVEEIWKKEINEFLEKYNKWLLDYESKNNKTDANKKSNGKNIKKIIKGRSTGTTKK